MKVVADSHIPYLRGVLEPYAEVAYLEPQAITSDVVKDADALLVRTRTRCDAKLLDESDVSFIGTATIGYDHIDRDYCQQKGIFWTNAPGCNAQGVCDYVESALHHLGYLPNKRFLLKNDAPLTIGIVGVGHVGKLVEKMAASYGMNILLCDPPRAMAEAAEKFVSIERIAHESDIITFHTPLTKEGVFPTWHMADETFFRACKPNALIINAARGGIIDEAALLQAANPCVIDCWEGEPAINRELLHKSSVATFHIAGYTKLGKYNATEMILSSFSDFFHLPILKIEKNVVPLQNNSIFDILSISENLKKAPEKFEELREAYELR